MGQTIATNKKAYRDFFLSDKWECGISLKGGEVKSLRSGGVNFKDAFARLEKGEIYLYNLYVEPYLQARCESDDPDRRRKLLLHKREIKKIAAIVAQKNCALVPTKIYFNNRGFAKVEIALGKGKKVFDKRETVKKRTIERGLKRTMQSRQKR